MKLIEIKGAVAAYLRKDVADLTVNGVDLGLLAMNNARQQAELLNDFEFSRQLVTVAVDGESGGSLESAVVFGTETSVSVKTVLDVGLINEDGDFVAVEWTTTEDSLRRQRGDNNRAIPRYPTDGQALSSLHGAGRFHFTGAQVYVFPVNAELDYSLAVEAYTFMADWTDANLLAESATLGTPWNTKGSQYLLWESVCSLNKLFKVFVPRQEGNLSPPEKESATALSNLIAWDSFKYEQFRQHTR